MLCFGEPICNATLSDRKKNARDLGHAAAYPSPMKTDHRREGETDAEAVARVFLAAGFDLNADQWPGLDLDKLRREHARKPKPGG